MTTATKTPAAGPGTPAAGRIRTAWVAAHAPEAGVPRWARVAAYAIPLTVLPSACGGSPRAPSTRRSCREAAGWLFLGVETVKTHVRNVLAKLGARDRVQAVITAFESGFIR